MTHVCNADDRAKYFVDVRGRIGLSREGCRRGIRHVDGENSIDANNFHCILEHSR